MGLAGQPRTGHTGVRRGGGLARLPLVPVRFVLRRLFGVGRRRARPGPGPGAARRPRRGALRERGGRAGPGRAGQRLAAARRRGLPAQVCEKGRCQELAGVGHKSWAPRWTGGAWYSGKGALRVKLYDFSVYLDEEASVRALRPLAAAASSEAATAALARSRDSEVSLVVRTARNLPLRTVKSEYRQILRRRLAKIGASSAQLRKFLDAFDPEKVPPACLEGASIKKGTQILFKKQGATTKISIGDQTIVAVRCPELSAAFMDIYLGDPAVHQGARAETADTALQMLRKGA